MASWGKQLLTLSAKYIGFLTILITGFVLLTALINGGLISPPFPRQHRRSLHSPNLWTRGIRQYEVFVDRQSVLRFNVIIRIPA